MENELKTSEQLIPELIGIRGGLSMISKLTDEIKEQEERSKEEEQKTQNAKNQYEEARKNKEDCQKSYQNQQAACNCLKAEADQQLRISQGKVRVQKKSYIRFFPDIGVGHFASIIALTVVYFIIYCCLGTVKTFLSAGIFFIPSLAHVLICGLIYSIRRSAEYAGWLNEAEKQHAGLVSRQREMEQDLSSRQAELELFREKADVAYQNWQAQIAHEEEIVDTCNKKIQNITMQARAVNTALQETYGIFLNESDWPNIDLIIHYIETGRADTLKEALIQVDRQRQTDQIVQAIQIAQKSIGHHIESAFARLGTALAQSFQRLDAHLQSFSGQLAESNQSSLASQQALMEKLDTQISVAQMNGVLLEKANRSSDELIHDLRYNQKYWIK